MKTPAFSSASKFAGGRIRRAGGVNDEKVSYFSLGRCNVAIGVFGIGIAQEPGANSSGGTQNATGQQRMQDRVSREVFHELVTLPQLTIFDNLQYKVDGNKVTLMGQVRDAILKDSAEKRVKSIEGVESVNNQIEILPASGNDDRIRREVARALFNDERLFRYSMGSVPPIHIIVKNGHVTLQAS